MATASAATRSRSVDTRADKGVARDAAAAACCRRCAPLGSDCYCSLSKVNEEFLDQDEDPEAGEGCVGGKSRGVQIGGKKPGRGP